MKQSRAIAKLSVAHAEAIKQRDIAVFALKAAYTKAVNRDEREPFDWAIYCEMLYMAIAEATGETT